MSTTGLLSKNREKDYDKGPLWDGDVLDRKAVADTLTPFIDSITQPFVISVDAPYGGGKTFFLKYWCRDLKEKGYKTVYFNAWESDFTTDPLAAFIASIGGQIDEFSKNNPSHTGKLVGAWKKVEKPAEVLIRRGVPLATKAVIRRLLGEEGLGELTDAIDAETKDDLINAVANASGDLVKDFQKQQKNLAEFQQSLTKAIKALTKGLPEERQKLIIFVDELDRCRPTYAVEVLERIKHLFCVPGTVFILGMNEKQMENAMSAVFGYKLDAEGYLRRFIDWRFRLPKPSNIQYSKFLFQRFEFPNLLRFSAKNARNSIRDSIDELDLAHGIFAEGLDLTLRQQEQCYTEFNLYLRTLTSGEPVFPAVLGAIGALRIAVPNMLIEALYSEEGRNILDAYLWERIDFRRQEIWSHRDWESFYPIFRTWFYRHNDAEFILGKSEGALPDDAGINEGRINGQNGSIKRDRDFWCTCANIHEQIKRDIPAGADMSLARTVMERLNHMDTIIPEAWV